MTIQNPPAVPNVDESIGSTSPDLPRGIIERRTQKIGRSIFQKMKKHESSKLSFDFLNEKLMNLMMTDEDLRYRMLRFVDVYPALRSSSSIATHLEEYLTSPDLATGYRPTHLSTLARKIGKERALTRAPISWASKLGITQMGSQFIAGHHPEEVSTRINKMEEEGFNFSLDLLGEFVVSEKQADVFQGRYLEMVQNLGDILGKNTERFKAYTGPRVNISIKLSSLTSKFEPMDPEGTSEDVRKRLRPLFRAAKESGAFLNIDMEKYEWRDLTLQIILDLLDEEEFAGFENIGTVHQAYLKDAEESLEWFLGELRRRRQQMTIRLVKGAYWDSEQIWAKQKGWPVPVYTDKRKTDACYERCAEVLLQNSDMVRTAIASHNVRSIAYTLALKDILRVKQDRFEIQMLYGMAGPIKDALLHSGIPVRIYTPCGELIPGMSYLVRRILENTSNESFLRQRFSEKTNVSSLLQNPQHTLDQHPLS